jgi:hypothetical protein
VAEVGSGIGPGGSGEPAVERPSTALAKQREGDVAAEAAPQREMDPQHRMGLEQPGDRELSGVDRVEA